MILARKFWAYGGMNDYWEEREVVGEYTDERSLSYVCAVWVWVELSMKKKMRRCVRACVCVCVCVRVCVCVYLCASIFGPVC